MIIGDQKEAAKFTEIFSAAPGWLLQFTRMSIDALLLRFHLPDKIEHLRWGDAGFDDARRWPFLPSGKLTAGDPIPAIDGRNVELAIVTALVVCCVAPHPVPNFAEMLTRPVEEDRSFLDDHPPLLRDTFFALDLDGKPEAEWTRYEQRRMRKLAEQISRL